MKVLKGIFGIVLLIVLFSSCNNEQDEISIDESQQTTKLFDYYERFLSSRRQSQL